MATIAPNGATPAVAIESPIDPIERLIREIEDVLAPLDARREQLEAELLDLNEERERLNAGIAGLSGQLPLAQPAAKKPGPKPAPGSKSRGQHDPSQKIVDDVFAAVLARTREGEDITCNEITDTLGLAKSTVLRGIAILRETERIRIVGTRKAAGDERVGGRGANAYTVMPS